MEDKPGREREHLFLVSTGASLPHSKSKSMTFSRLPSVVNAKEKIEDARKGRSLSYNYYYPKVRKTGIEWATRV